MSGGRGEGGPARVGVVLGSGFPLASLARINRGIFLALSARHELVHLPPEYPYASPEERRAMAEAFLRRCDVVAGLLDLPLLAARARIGRRVPYLYFTHGDLSAGAWDVRAALPYLTSADVMLVNCAPEVEIARLLLGNAGVRVVPFTGAEEFYPLGDDERRAVRRRFRWGDDDRVVLFSGRVIPEKNVHTLLAVFEVVREQVPGAHLVLAGPMGTEEKGLERFGVRPVSLSATYSRLIARMDAADRVHTPGSMDTRRLRELYNAADVAVSLTLNPDENFGMAQVEAMACGTPVVGTAWGGLMDTIDDGVTGCRVSTVSTPTGVKCSWWEAINQIVRLLRDDGARRELRERCPGSVAARYSLAALEGALHEIVAASVRGAAAPAEPLRATAFAEELWSVCEPRLPGPAYRRSPRAEALYAALVTPFTAGSAWHVPAGEPLAPDQVVSLATPVHPGAGSVRPDDVFYPYDVPVPEEHRGAVEVLLEVLRESPAFVAGEIADPGPESAPVAQALMWMVRAGLVLRTRSDARWLDPAVVGRRLSEPAFTVQRVDPAADLLVSR